MALGTLLQPLFRDANAALVLSSVLLEMGAVAVVYYVAREIFGSGAGWAAGFLLIASVTFWTYGGVALTYPALATFSALTALFAYQTIFQKRKRLYACAAACAAGSGFRPELALFLFPLVLAACYRQPMRRAAIALAILVAGVLLWLVPTALLSGGFAEYWMAFVAYTQTDVLERYAPAERGLAALLINIHDTGQYLFFALYFEAVVVAMGVLLLAWRRQWPKLAFFALWIAPMLAFYVLVHIGDPGYVFGVLPALLTAGAGGWVLWLEDRGPAFVTLAPAGLTLVLMGNVMLFFLHDRPLTYPGLRAADASNGARIDYMRRFAPADVLIVSYDSYKQLRYYLPDYTNTVWLDTTTPDQQVFPIPQEAHWALLTDPSVFALAQALPADADLLEGDTWVARLPVQGGQLLVYENRRLSLR